MAGLKKDLTLLKQVQRVLGVLETFCEKLRDTYMELGAESYAAARIFYRSAQNAAKTGVEGCEYIARDLGEYYKKLSAPRKKKEITRQKPLKNKELISALNRRSQR